MLRHKGPGASLKFDLHQLEGNCFAVYIRIPCAWNGLRAIHHVHKGPCRKDCAPNCEGYNKQVAEAVLLVSKFRPTTKCRRSLDDVVAEIARGNTGRRRRA